MVAGIFVVSIAVGVSTSNLNEPGDVSLAGLGSVAAQSENDNTYNCPGGKTECVRVIVGHTTHIFYKKEKE